MKHSLFRLSILALLLALCTSMSAFEVNGINYNITATSTVEVTSGGQYIGDIVIPETVDYEGKTYSVTSIGDNAFQDCSSLTSITIPNSVTSIGEFAFDQCIRLTSITIPNSVTSIGEWAFNYCISLTSLTIPNSVTSIGWGAFGQCSGLTSVTIPNSVTSIGEDVFSSCI